MRPLFSGEALRPEKRLPEVQCPHREGGVRPSGQVRFAVNSVKSKCHADSQLCCPPIYPNLNLRVVDFEALYMKCRDLPTSTE
jgi:hypothetical protein